MELEIIETRDGSSSLFVPEINETYHSTHGAIAEAKYVFIKQGIEHYLGINTPKSINILEVGFGTGLNALLTASFIDKISTKINYHTLETTPLSKELIEKLNYTELLTDFNSKELLVALHKAEWEALVEISSNFNIKKINQPLTAFKSETMFDLVFFDAFAPSKQPEMWEGHIFDQLIKMMNQRSFLVTYCAQGQFKRNLKSAGFEVESLPGPPPKKEMVRAFRP